MKNLIICSLFLYTISSFSQKNDGIKFFKVINDTILFYLNDVGDITIKSNANFYRKSCIDKINFIYSGQIVDYYPNNQKAYECFSDMGILSGDVKYYYKNGKLKLHGFYNNSLKDSIWTFYYNNGNIEKIVFYKSNIPSLKEFYKKNGNIIFNNGNGKYKGSIISGYKQTTKYNISGNIKNGKFDGKWNLTGSTNAVEYFENGNFIKGSSYGLVYTTDPKINLFGFDLHENVDFFKFIAVPKTDFKQISFSQMFKYKGSNNLNSNLRSELIDYLIEIDNENNLLNYWCFIQFNIDKSNNIENINAYSNNDVIADNIEHFISNLKGFETAKPSNQPVDCAVYLFFYLENNKLYFPEYYFGTGFNIMNFIPNN